MPKFLVYRPEVHFAEVEIEAETAEAALEAVQVDMDGEEKDSEYSHVLTQGWKVKKAGDRECEIEEICPE